MKKRYGKLLSFALAITMMFSVPVVTNAAEAPSVNKSDIVILYDMLHLTIKFLQAHYSAISPPVLDL